MLEQNLSPDALLTDVELAKLAKRSPRTFRVWRQRGTGPRYVRIGERGIRYRWGDWLAYVGQNTVGGAA